MHQYCIVIDVNYEKIHNFQSKKKCFENIELTRKYLQKKGLKSKISIPIKQNILIHPRQKLIKRSTSFMGCMKQDKLIKDQNLFFLLKDIWMLLVYFSQV